MMSDVAVEISMFERIGGALTIDRLVEGFYRRMDVLPEAKGIRATHATDLEPTKNLLKRYLCEWMGGRSFIPPKRDTPGCASGIWASKSVSGNAMRGCFV
jgi:hemoglobin